MAEYEFDISELIGFMKKLGSKLPDFIESALTDYGLMLESMIVDEIDAMKLNVSGEMKKSVTSEVKKMMQGWVVTVGPNVKTASGYPYPVGVHEGTIAHWPPVAPISEWVRRKLGIIDQKANAKATWFIRKKISQSGTKAHPFMSRVFIKERYQVRKEITKALFRQMKQGKYV